MLTYIHICKLYDSNLSIYPIYPMTPKDMPIMSTLSHLP